jgi:hypothetical protein
MSGNRPPLPFTMDQMVSRRGDPAFGAGRVAGYILTTPPLVIIRWPGKLSTFESPEALVEARSAA